MEPEHTLRNVQDKARNAGRRIQHVPWTKPGKVEMIYNTPLTLLMAFGGMAVFIGMIVLVLNQKVPPSYLGFGVAGPGLIFVSRIYAAWHK